jgi:integrase
MATSWIKTQYRGIRYREHPERKYNGKPDRYFTIRYKINGKLKEEGIGWASEEWNAQKVSLLRNDLIKGHKTGSGPATLSEKRLMEIEKKEEERLLKEQEKKDETTFKEFFNDIYFPNTMVDKSQKSWKREEQLFRLWIDPIIGDLPLKEVSSLQLERIKQNMGEAGRSARSIRYMLAVIRQVFNYARYCRLFIGENPTKNVKFPQADNKRMRYLSADEAGNLLKELKKRSVNLYEISLISLRIGARADEIFGLKWGDIDIENGRLTLWDTKNKKTRVAYMTRDVIDVFERKKKGKNSDLIFPGRGGIKIVAISESFNRAVKKIGLNNGISDVRMKVVFHTLRHTYASWLVQKGVPLYTVKVLMGHTDIKMTERYSHLGNKDLEDAVRHLDEIKFGFKTEENK